jgi:DNA repair protein RadA
MPKEKKAIGEIKELADIPGIGDGIVKKLQTAGYHSLARVANSNAKSLQTIEGIGAETANKIVEAAREQLNFYEFETAEQIERNEEQIARITTSSKELDELLLHPKLRGKIRGGVESMLITEAYGRYASGKSALGFQLAINVQLPTEKGGLDGSCIFLDTEMTFRSIRIKEMAEKRGYDAEKMLSNIYYQKVVSTDHLQRLLMRAEQYIREKNVKLIIVDSIAALLRKEFHTRDQLPIRQATLNDVLMNLQSLANIYNIPVYITNQVMDRPDALPFVDPTMPVGGNILGHATQRIYLRKAKDNNRIARLVDSSCLPMGEALFKITEEGISDAE